MLGAEFEARSDGKRDGRRVTYTGVPAEAWINEWKETAKNKEIWEKASAETVETIKMEVTAKCEGVGLDRPVEEIANFALKAGGRGAMGLDMRVCPRCGDTLHPLGFTHHVKKCNETRRNYNIVMRSKVCNVCGISMSRESMPRHEAMCSARLEALNPPKLVKRRITKKNSPCIC